MDRRVDVFSTRANILNKISSNVIKPNETVQLADAINIVPTNGLPISHLYHDNYNEDAERDLGIPQSSFTPSSSLYQYPTYAPNRAEMEVEESFKDRPHSMRSMGEPLANSASRRHSIDRSDQILRRGKSKV